MRSEINYNEVCYCVTVTGIPTFRIKITHNTLTDELNRPRLLSIRASHNTTSLALSWLFHVAPCFEQRASCNICNLHRFIIIHRDNTVVNKSMVIWHTHTHTHASGRKFWRFFNIGCSRRCVFSLTPLASWRPGRQFSERIPLGMVKTESQTPAWKLNPKAQPRALQVFLLLHFQTPKLGRYFRDVCELSVGRNSPTFVYDDSVQAVLAGFCTMFNTIG